MASARSQKDLAVVMFVRFISSEVHRSTGAEKGIFCLARKLRDSDILPEEEQQLLAELVDWFNQYLDAPTRFSRTRRETYRAVCWFKSSAREHIRKIFEMIQIIEGHLLDVEMIWATEPGEIVYEDEFQVAAIPYRRRR